MTADDLKPCPDATKTMFICGASPKRDTSGLPETISICPAYGADWSKLYIRADLAPDTEGLVKALEGVKYCLEHPEVILGDYKSLITTIDQALVRHNSRSLK